MTIILYIIRALIFSTEGYIKKLLRNDMNIISSISVTDIVLEAVLKFKSILQLDNKYVLC